MATRQTKHHIVCVGNRIIGYIDPFLSGDVFGTGIVSTAKSIFLIHIVLADPVSYGMFVLKQSSGLFAPHWQSDARGCMVGLTASHSKAHIVRAALESSAYQVSHQHALMHC